MIFMCLLSSFSWAADNANVNLDDIYVRKDVYNSDMKNINNKLDNILTRLDTLTENVNKLTQAVAVLSERIENVNTSLNAKIENVSQSLNDKIDAVDKRLSDKIDSVNTSLNTKIDNVNQSLSDKIDAVDQKLSVRMDDLRNGLYLVLTLIAFVASLPVVKNWYEDRAKRKAESRVPSITLQDVKNLIEENNAMLLRKIQGGVI